MTEAAQPSNEAERLAALRGLEILDTPPELAFDQITSLAAKIFDVPIAVVSLVDQDREWFKSCYGTDTTQADRKIAFCAHTILRDDVLVVEDATNDSRFADNPQVTDGGIRFYAGAPLCNSQGLSVGALCLKALEPRSFGDTDVEILEELAGYVVREFEVRLAADELQKSNLALERSNQELQEFSYIASHDLQEPLRKLVSFSALLSDDLGENIPEEAQRDLSFIVDSARRMQSLITDLLELSRIGGRDLELRRQPIDRCVDAAIADVGGTSRATPSVHYDELPELTIDEHLLETIFRNLLDNAVKFVPEDRTPEIHITAEKIPGEWKLEVRDNGIGFKPEYREQIFVPFRRLHSRQEYGGTGIGLAICRKAAQRLGGRIEVDSEPGVGSVFRILLPAHESASELQLAP